MILKLDLSALKSALLSLEAAIGIVNDTNWFCEQSEALRNTLTAGVIQNFEFVYEISFKMIKRQLELEAATPSNIDQCGFRDLLRMAAEKGMIDDADAWFRYREMRNNTSHTYDHVKANAVCADIHAFLEDARKLYAALERGNA